MKKYFYAFLIALIIGFFLCNFFLNQYDDYKGIKVSSTGEELYFIEYGKFSNLKSMEENTISLENYIYNIVDGLYYVYVGITNSEKVDKKLLKRYETTEQKSLVVVDDKNIKIENVSKPLVTLDDNTLKHDNIKLALEIMNILAK